MEFVDVFGVYSFFKEIVVEELVEWSCGFGYRLEGGKRCLEG